jgi:hypothetical protein
MELDRSSWDRRRPRLHGWLTFSSYQMELDRSRWDRRRPRLPGWLNASLD